MSLALTHPFLLNIFFVLFLARVSLSPAPGSLSYSRNVGAHSLVDFETLSLLGVKLDSHIWDHETIPSPSQGEFTQPACKDPGTAKTVPWLLSTLFWISLT